MVLSSKCDQWKKAVSPSIFQRSFSSFSVPFQRLKRSFPKVTDSNSLSNHPKSFCLNTEHDTREDVSQSHKLGSIFSRHWDTKLKGLKRAMLIAGCLCLLSIRPPSAMAETASSTGFSIANAIKGLVDFVLHLDVHLGSIIAKHGAATYALLFGIVFCETGLVLTPFLPGDSLLFAAGAFAGIGKLNILFTSGTFIVAAILGDAVNYAMGSFLGQKALDAKLVPESYIQKTETFFERHGGKTIVIARFVPIIRTFAPFVAGISHMQYPKFAAFNIGGAFLWTFLLCGAGFFFGNLPFVEKNFSLVVLAVILISILPIFYEVYISKKESQNSNQSHSETSS